MVLDTDTRSCAPAQAASRTYEIAAHCRDREVTGVYKKVDSVLRGQVAAELVALLDALRLERCLLVPANPGLGRVLVGGRYLVNGVPLHETDFGLDPEYPAMTADVLERVSASGLDRPEALFLRSPGGPLPERGIVVGEAESDADLAVWGAVGAGPGTLAAGASEFFGAFLRALGHLAVERATGKGAHGATRDLFVCGSTSAGSRGFCRESEARGVPVLRLPDRLMQPPEAVPDVDVLVGQWADKVIRALAESPRVVVAIDRPLCPEPGMPQVLSRYLSAAVGRVLAQVKVDRLFAEGGATAVSLVRCMGWTRMRVRREWATGVVSLELVGQDAPLVSMKPGSYTWPEAVLANAGTGVTTNGNAR
jgi:uncharacterized protein YgbK (DUF1537 family)